MKYREDRRLLISCIGLFVIISIITACKVTAPSTAGLKFIPLAADSASFLIKHVKSDSIPVCLVAQRHQETENTGAEQKRPIIDEGVSAPDAEAAREDEKWWAQRQAEQKAKQGNVAVQPLKNTPPVSVTLDAFPEEELKGHVRKAVLDWIEPLRGFTPAKLVSDIRFLSRQDGCTAPSGKEEVSSSELNAGLAALTVVFHQDLERSHVGLTASHLPPIMYLGRRNYEKSGYKVILHEMGHAFGLADTYIDLGTTRRLGQPHSLMYSLENGQLQQDDIDGIRFLYCKNFPSDIDAAVCDSLNQRQRLPNNGRFQINIALEDYNVKGEQGARIVSIGSEHSSSLANQSGIVIFALQGERVKSSTEFHNLVKYVQHAMQFITYRRINADGSLDKEISFEFIKFTEIDEAE